MITTIIILSITTLVFGFTTWNLLRKNEATEDVVEEQEKMISDFAKIVDDSMRKMKDLDTKEGKERFRDLIKLRILSNTYVTMLEFREMVQRGRKRRKDNEEP